ncbi:DMT family transporter [Shewanella insulae]|uniref:DMT family transporter n=1 Tax=Shewanella insulae TaxID=2681496 RepID=UPI001EFD9BB3|nr:DMT family transporter [Shewanella insulae]MCG9755808.1 DMT family transporter [Shewanella insulae]
MTKQLIPRQLPQLMPQEPTQLMPQEPAQLVPQESTSQAHIDLKPQASTPLNLMLGLLGGVALAVMIALNSELAKYGSPLLASWVAHGVGTLVALLLLGAVRLRQGCLTRCNEAAPWWAYLGGLPGAFTVVLGAMTVNSALGLSASIAFIMAGQILFGLVCDRLGLFGMARRRLSWGQGAALAVMALGALIVLLAQEGA